MPAPINPPPVTPPTAPDAAQTLFLIPKEILDTFSGIVRGFGVIQRTDWLGLGLVGLGLLVLLIVAIASLRPAGQAIDESVRKYLKLQTGAAEKSVKGLV